MIQMLRKRLDRKDEGFTLIELMVVVLIIAILLAIAIPTFLGARSRAQNRSAQSNLRNALTAEKTAYTDAQTYVASTTSLQSIEPSLSWLATAPAASVPWTGTDVLVSTQDSGNEVCLTDKSASGTYYGIIDIGQNDTAFASGTVSPGTYYYKGSAVATCTGAVGDLSVAGVANSTTGASW